MAAFREDPSVTCFLVSLKAAGVGNRKLVLRNLYLSLCFYDFDGEICIYVYLDQCIMATRYPIS